MYGFNVKRLKYTTLKEITYILLNFVPEGKVVTYGVLAEMLKVSPRLIGKILSENENPIIIPCHRVVKSNGDVGGYSCYGGVGFKMKLLKFEGVKFKGSKVLKECIIDDANYFTKLFS